MRGAAEGLADRPRFGEVAVIPGSWIGDGSLGDTQIQRGRGREKKMKWKGRDGQSELGRGARACDGNKLK